MKDFPLFSAFAGPCSLFRSNGRKQLVAFSLIFLLLLPLGQEAAASGKVLPDLSPATINTHSERQLYDKLDFNTEGMSALYLFDSSHKTDLYAWHSEESLPCSLAIKLMLCLLACEKLKSQGPLTVSEEAAQLDADVNTVLRCEVGQRLSLELVLLKLLYENSEAAARMLADALAPNDKLLLAQMNQRAAAIGLKQSYFGSVHEPAAVPPENDPSDLSLSDKFEPVSNTSSLRDLALLVQALQRLDWPQLLPEQRIYHTQSNGNILVFDNPLPRVWQLANNKPSAVFSSEFQGLSLVVLLSGESPYQTICLGFSRHLKAAENSAKLLELLRQSESYYLLSKLVSKYQPYYGAKGFSTAGDRFDLMYLQDLVYIHPEGDAFLVNPVEYQASEPLTRPIERGTASGFVSFTLADGRKLSVEVGAATAVIPGNNLWRQLLTALQENPNLANLLWLLSALLALCFLWQTAGDLIQIVQIVQGTPHSSRRKLRPTRRQMSQVVVRKKPQKIVQKRHRQDQER